ncbi:prepilin-type N-terminal cleavage/methylation domain-containing protein [Lysinibacillus odysseyi]|uniref:Prepilin-type N-terminal cleavage/methylation domain-containing protein n=1 Tax=Lysinibacillus odysseyi 34hs-1 = NBRC 100172 TaxID=1220589 RepID=A0A0A3IJC8_9BACI|nr:prepilin-type N-terminal cleavage/methylation domain-containing protein [Lysinibacillus odysseyi]KGR84819.1 hypothetical protein CD32_10175 [Lysinibacillus odysseyi 34hs-1 = NBRC 100172]
MFQQMKKRIKNEKGLTLIELLAVIVILAIVAAIAIPAIGNIINNSRDKAILSEATNVIAGAKLAKIDGVCGEGSTKPCTNTTTDIGKYIEGVKGTFTTYYDGTEWVITYGEMSKISSGGKFNGMQSLTLIKESVIKNALDKGSYSASTPAT